MVAVLELQSSDSVALNSPRRARVVDEAGLEEIEMCDAGLAGVELRGERRGRRGEGRATCGFKQIIWRSGPRNSLPDMAAPRCPEVVKGHTCSSPSPGAAPLGPASSLFDMDFDWLFILLGLGGVRLVEMSSQVCHFDFVTPDAT